MAPPTRPDAGAAHSLRFPARPTRFTTIHRYLPDFTRLGAPPDATTTRPQQQMEVHAHELQPHRSHCAGQSDHALHGTGVGRPSVSPGNFGMLRVGCCEGRDSERGIAWRCGDSLLWPQFLKLGPGEPVLDHTTFARTHVWLPLEWHETPWVLVGAGELVFKLAGGAVDDLHSLGLASLSRCWKRRTGQPILACEFISIRDGTIGAVDRTNRAMPGWPVDLLAHGGQP
jgi:hypothetical protein